MFCVSSGASAYDFEVDGIYYNNTSGPTSERLTAEVMFGQGPSGSYTGSITIPATVEYEGDTYTVTRIGGNAFSFCSGLTEITLPETIETIGALAFSWCRNLKSINIPDGVTSIESGAFTGCGLTSIDIPDGVVSLGDNTFYDCNSLVSVDIPDGVTSIRMSTFSGCSSLVSIDIPGGVASIGEGAFSGCSSLAEITCRATVPPVCGERCFAYVDISNCTLSVPEGAEEAYKTADVWKEFLYEYFISGGIKYGALTSSQGNIATVLAGGEYTGDITIPETVENGGITYTVTEIGGRAFYECEGLVSINIPDGVTSIGDETFYECLGLESVTLGSGVGTIGDGAFIGCSSLAEITCRATVPPVCGQDCFAYVDISNCTLSVPEGAEEAYKTADVWKEFFYEYFMSGGIRYGAQTSPQGNIATVLAGEYTGDITIPATVENGGITYTVTSIGDRAFYRCSSLKSVTLGSGLETIGDYVFYGCRSLAEITCRATVPPVCGPRSFDYVDKYTCTLNVPEGTADDYRTADVWKEFFNIVETDFAGSGEIAADATAAAKVYAAAGRIVVENAAAGTPIAVYTADGVQVYGGTASDGRTEIPAQAGKLYIVRCGNAAYKTAM